MLGPLYHLTAAEDRRRTLREAARILEPGGRLFAAAPRLEYFTTACLHRPDELGAEATAAGLLVDGVFGIEGPGWLVSDIDVGLGDERRRDDVLRVARIFEAEDSVVGVSALVSYRSQPLQSRR